ncbi:hypothetical protein LTR86_008443 [Recurvomyces mirabilis]|nr:hypothetical protein LTR86_008443 [Recurvomyces mirabilis]
MVAAYHAYQRLYKSQSDLNVGLEDGKAFARTFGECPRLVDITLTMQHKLRLTTTNRVEAYRAGMVFPFGDRGGSLGSISSLHAILSGALQAGRYLRSLSVEPLHYAYFTWAWEHTPEVLLAIANLRHLHLGLCNPFDVVMRENEHERPECLTEMHKALELGHVINFVASAPELSSLVMSGPEFNSDEVDHVSVSDLVGDVYWPKLSSLTLRWVRCTEEELLSLLRRHKSTLESLELVTITLKNESWDHLMKALAGTLPRLKTGTIRGTLTDEVPSRVGHDFPPPHLVDISDKPWYMEYQDYIVKGGTVAPYRFIFQDEDFDE